MQRGFLDKEFQNRVSLAQGLMVKNNLSALLLTTELEALNRRSRELLASAWIGSTQVFPQFRSVGNKGTRKIISKAGVVRSLVIINRGAKANNQRVEIPLSEPPVA